MCRYLKVCVPQMMTFVITLKKTNTFTKQNNISDWSDSIRIGLEWHFLNVRVGLTEELKEIDWVWILSDELTLNFCVDDLKKCFSGSVPQQEASQSSNDTQHSSLTIESIPGVKGHTIKSLEKPSLEQFRAAHFGTRIPVKLTGKNILIVWESLHAVEYIKVENILKDFTAIWNCLVVVW